MDETFNQDVLLKKLKDTKFLKDKTKQEYLNRIDDFCKYLDKDLKYCLENPSFFVKKVKKYCEDNKFGVHTADKICSCFLAVFNYNQDLKEKYKHIYDKWIDEVQIFKDQIDKKYEKNRPTTRQEQSYVDYDTVVKTIDKLIPGSQERLLLAMYTLIPPVRNDYHLLKIYKRNPNYDKGNYIVLNKSNSLIILNEFKTDKTYDKIKIKVPKRLHREIELSFQNNSRDFLFVSTTNNTPYKSANTFNKWCNRTLEKIFNKPLTLTDLRHIFISRRDLKLEEQSGEDRKKISQIMGHSLEQQQRYLWHSFLKE